MISNFFFENYKSFEKGEIELKPITILLGANSVGKSSIIQLLLLLQQTAYAEEGYNSALKLNGDLLEVGENINIFREKKNNKPIVLKFDFENENLYRRLKRTYLDELIGDIVRICYEYFNEQINNWMKNKEKISKKILNEILNQNKKILDILGQGKLDIIKEATEQRNHFEVLLKLSKLSDSTYLDLYDFLKTLRQLQEPKFTIVFEINYLNENILYLSKLILYNKKNPIVLFKINEKGKYSLSSPHIRNGIEIIDKTKQSEVNKYIKNRHSTIFSILKKTKDDYLEEEECDVLLKKIFEILSSSISTVESFFLKDKINHVNPRREEPKRIYLLDNANNNLYENSNEEAMIQLLKVNNELKNKVNNWLKRFDVKIKVVQIKDNIHELIVEQHGIELTIADVGFGISQVLPVLVHGFFSENNTLTMMEQPEIHLHPTMQADLTDSFIEIITTKERRYLLVETHSEYILNRLRRRIAEGKEITNEDVAIYVIERNQDQTTIKPLEIPKKGGFQYPEDFYSGELLNDTIIFLKSQNN
ncbi:MAG: AAA family ATPase [Fibrobacter sp.]|jgi:predicted ATPase|nr:AAA family ATPase [Fibrobacter sp.]